LNVTCELFNAEKHYEIVGSWWTAAGWPVLPLSHLSDIGQVISVDGVPAVCGWIFQTDSAWCLFEFVVANPEVRKAPRALAMSTLIGWAKAAAEDMGFKNVFSSISNPMLIKRYEREGFKVTDSGMTNLVYKVEA